MIEKIKTHLRLEGQNNKLNVKERLERRRESLKSKKRKRNKNKD